MAEAESRSKCPFPRGHLERSPHHFQFSPHVFSSHSSSFSFSSSLPTIPIQPIHPSQCSTLSLLPISILFPSLAAPFGRAVSSAVRRQGVAPAHRRPLLLIAAASLTESRPIHRSLSSSPAAQLSAMAVAALPLPAATASGLLPAVSAIFSASSRPLSIPIRLGESKYGQIPSTTSASRRLL
jgi:hypothetical protein